MNLPALEMAILELHGRLSLRPTVEAAAKIGELLFQAKQQIPHGRWLPWVTRLGLGRRTAQVYLQMYTHAENAQHSALSENLSIRQFLSMLTSATQKARQAERADRWADVGETAEEKDYRVATADCRAYDWPLLDAIATDPAVGRDGSLRVGCPPRKEEVAAGRYRHAAMRDGGHSDDTDDVRPTHLRLDYGRSVQHVGHCRNDVRFSNLMATRLNLLQGQADPATTL